VVGRWIGWLAFGVAMTTVALAAAAGVIVVVVGTAPGLIREFGFVWLAVPAAAAPVAYGLAIAVHEFGHVLGARAVGYVPLFVHVGPLTFQKVDLRWRAGWDRRQPWYAGKTVCFLRARNRWRTAVFIAAGPLASLLSGLIAGEAATRPGPVALGTLIGFFAVFSLFFGLANLLPVRDRRLDSDGRALLRLVIG
jgi:hypothetical protein